MSKVGVHDPGRVPDIWKSLVGVGEREEQVLFDNALLADALKMVEIHSPLPGFLIWENPLMGANEPFVDWDKKEIMVNDMYAFIYFFEGKKDFNRATEKCIAFAKQKLDARLDFLIQNILNHHGR